ncbi:MAG: methionine biosynthesis protein MetW [Deltaproteobacteria bacterium]
MRFDLQVIASWIEPGARVVDLGCGEGELLSFLKEEKGVKAVGIEKDEHEVSACIAKGLSVLHGDFSQEVDDYPPNAFDYVVLSQTLQQVYEPVVLLQKLLAIGRRVIVSFPNFSHWRIRWQLLSSGHAPVSRELPFAWYETPNIRVITLKDFRKFARERGITIYGQAAVGRFRNGEGRLLRFLPDWRASSGIFLIGLSGDGSDRDKETVQTKIDPGALSSC